MRWFLYGLAAWTTFLFACFGLFITTCLIYDRWHRKKIRHDPATCKLCRYGEERNEYFR